MAKVKLIHINVYKRGIYVFAGKHEEFKKWVINEFTGDKDWDNFVDFVQRENSNALASFWYNTITGEGVIEIPKLPRTSNEIAYCAHECLHAAFHVLDFVGVKYDPNTSNESFTYLLELLLANLLDINDYKTI